MTPPRENPPCPNAAPFHPGEGGRVAITITVTPMGDASPSDRDSSEPPELDELIDDLDDLSTTVGAEAREEIRETKRVLVAAGERGLLPSGVRRLDPRDAAEAFVGSVIFASPLLVEDGIFDIADHLFGSTISGIPVFLIANTVFVVVMTYALVEWTGRDREEVNRLFEVIPVRVTMILVVSFVVSAALMTVWGRVGDWSQPTEAIARITVLWTVGSLGAALGDIISEDPVPEPIREQYLPEDTTVGDSTSTTQGRRDGSDSTVGDEVTEQTDDGALVAELHDQFDDLEAIVTENERARELRQIRTRTTEATLTEGFGDHIRKYTSRDIAEAFVGSVFFSIPLLVEDGVFDVAAYFLSLHVSGFPIFLLVNGVFVLTVVAALVYWTGPQEVEVSRPLFGLFPRRLVGIALVSFITAAILMTMWGRVDGWEDPLVALARVSAVWSVAAFGAALGDILPGESSGDDINDDLADLGEQVGDLVDVTD